MFIDRFLKIMVLPKFSNIGKGRKSSIMNSHIYREFLILWVNAYWSQSKQDIKLYL